MSMKTRDKNSNLKQGENEMAYIITHNIIDEKAKRERTKEEQEKYPYAFRLYYDDGELYFKGYSDNANSERAFAPLDGIGQSYGCTEIKYSIQYPNGTRKFETL